MPYQATTHHGKVILYDLKEFAEFLGITSRTAWSYIKKNKIPAQMIKGKWYISEPNLLAFYQGAKYTERTGNIGRYAKRGEVIEPPHFQGVYDYSKAELTEGKRQ